MLSASQNRPIDSNEFVSDGRIWAFVAIAGNDLIGNVEEVVETIWDPSGWKTLIGGEGIAGDAMGYGM